MRRMKKMLCGLLALTLVMGAFSGCTSKKEEKKENRTEATSTDDKKEASKGDDADMEVKENEGQETENNEQMQDGKFVLEYPQDMQELGYTEPLVLDKKPQRVVCLSSAPVLALYEMGVNMVGIPKNSVIKWPEDLANKTESVSFSAMSPDDFDYESVVALKPDLVLLTSGGADTAGKKLNEFNINIYYIKGGHTVSYDSVKMQTEALIKAFGTGEAEAAGGAIMQRFADLEAEVEAAKKAFAGKKVMVLQSSGERGHYIQTKGGTLGSMLDMIGFENVYTDEKNPMMKLDMEQALDYKPDYVVCVGGSSAEDHKKVMEKAFSENPEYWNAIPAIKDGNVVYMDVEYVATTGINVIKNISDLIETMSSHSGIAVK